MDGVGARLHGPAQQHRVPSLKGRHEPYIFRLGALWYELGERDDPGCPTSCSPNNNREIRAIHGILLLHLELFQLSPWVSKGGIQAAVRNAGLTCAGGVRNVAESWREIQKLVQAQSDGSRKIGLANPLAWPE